MPTVVRFVRWAFNDWLQAALALGGIGLVVVSIYPDWLALGFGGFGPKQVIGACGGGAMVVGALALQFARRQPWLARHFDDGVGQRQPVPGVSLVERVRAKRWFTWAIGLAWGVAVVVLVAMAVNTIISPLWTQTLDDAYITLRYSRNLVDGYGLRWNPTDVQPVEGFTSLTHVLLGSILLAFGLDPVSGTKVVGLLCLAALVGLSAWHARRNAAGLVGFGVATLLIVGNPFLPFAAIQGMDTMLACLAVTLCTVLVYASLDHPRWLPWLFSAMVGAVLTRPDIGLLVTLYLFPVALKYWSNPSLWRWAAALLVLPGLIYIIFKLAYFGDLLPTTFYFKSRLGQLPQLSIVVDFALRFMAAPVLLLAAWVVTRKGRSAELYITAALCIAIGYFATVRPAVAMGYRFLIPFLPALIIGLIVPVRDLARLAGEAGVATAHRALAAGMVGFVLLMAIPTPKQYATDAAQLHFEGLRMDPLIGRALAGIPNAQSIRLVTGEAGAIPYFSNMFHVDPYGLVTKDHRTNPFNPDMVFENPPDIFVTHTLALEVGADGELVLDYEPIRWALEYPDVGTTKFSVAIITDPRFVDYEMVAKLPTISQPGPASYHFVFLRKSSPYYDMLKARVKTITVP